MFGGAFFFFFFWGGWFFGFFFPFFSPFLAGLCPVKSTGKEGGGKPGLVTAGRRLCRNLPFPACPSLPAGRCRRGGEAFASASPAFAVPVR